MENQVPVVDGFNAFQRTIDPDKLVISRKDQEILRCLAGQVAREEAQAI